MEKIESQSISVVILKSISASVKRVLIRLKTVDNFPCLSTMPFWLLIPSPELSFLFHEGSICLLLNSFFSVYVHPLELRVPTASFHFVPFLSLLGQTASVFAAIILKKKNLWSLCGSLGIHTTRQNSYPLISSRSTFLYFGPLLRNTRTTHLIFLRCPIIWLNL